MGLLKLFLHLNQILTTKYKIEVFEIYQVTPMMNFEAENADLCLY